MLGTARIVLAMTVVCAMLAACASPVEHTVIDGWAVGDRYECVDEGQFQAAECRTYVPIAAAALDRRDQGHPPVVEVTLHRQLFPMDNGELVPLEPIDGRPVPIGDQELGLAICSGGCMSIAVFRLLDGSYRAIAVGTPGVNTEAITSDFGPIGRP